MRRLEDNDAVLKGAGGGGGGDVENPVRTPDDLYSQDWMEMVIGLGQGPIQGLAPGIHNKLENFFVGDTSLYSSGTGQTNFPDFLAIFYSGASDDPAVNFRLGGPASNSPVGVTLTQNVSVTRSTPAAQRGKINRLEIRLQFSQLLMTSDKGTFEGTGQFQIAFKPSNSSTWAYFNNQTTTTITGKTSAGAVKDFLINVPVLTDDDWDVRVTKLSDDNVGDQGNVCVVAWESMQMVALGTRNYPDTAVAHLFGRATGQFSSIPDFSGIYDGLICRVPTNYDPIAKTYNESTPWDGSLKWAWTNNPAWILYELCINEVFGLPAYYLSTSANRYDFYTAAKWCDEQVAIPGTGQTQPRFTFNATITDQQQGMDLLRYIAGSFDSTMYDDGVGNVTLKTGQPRTPIYIFAPEDITPEGFSYSYTDIPTRYNDITVVFSNPDLNYAEDRRKQSIDNTAAIARNGRIPYEFTAVGCTDVHEAVRRANYRYMACNTELATVSFTTNRKGMLPELYDPIHIADPDAGWSTGGRIKSLDGNTIHLRDPIYFAVKTQCTMRIQTYDGERQLTVEPPTDGAVYSLAIITGSLDNSEIPDRTTFTVEDQISLGLAKPFRVLTIEEANGTADQFTITAIEVNLDKYPDADAGTQSASIPYSYKTPGEPVLPAELVLESGLANMQILSDGTLIYRIFANWQRPPMANTVSYELDYSEVGSGVWTTVKANGDSAYLGPVKDGIRYNVRLFPIKSNGQRGPKYLERLSYLVTSKVDVLDTVAGLNVEQGNTGWRVSWIAGDFPDYAGVEVRRGTTLSVWDNAMLVTPLAQGTLFVLPWLTAQTHRIFVKYKDTSGNYSGEAAYFDLVVDPPAQPVITGYSEYSTVYLKWQECETVQPLYIYKMRVGGSDWETAEPLTSQNAITYTSIEQTAGTRRYWVVAIDAGGNESAPGYKDLEVVLTIEDALTQIENEVLAEIAPLQTAIDTLNTNLGEEVTRAQEAEAGLNQSILDKAAELQSNLDDVNADLLQSIANEASTAQTNLEGVQNDLQGKIDGINAQVAEILGAPDYDAGTTYHAGDYVKYNGKLYQATQDTTGNDPTNATYWKDLGDYSSLGDQLAAQAVQISDLNTSVSTIDGELTAETSAREALAAQMRGGYTGTDLNSVTEGLVYLEKEARVTGDETNATAITALSGRLDDAQHAIDTNTSAISTLQTDITNIDGDITANTSAITALQSDMTDARSDIDAHGEAISGLTTRMTDAEGTISSNTSAITSLDSRVTTAEGLIEGQGTAISTLQSDVSTNAGNIESNTSAITSLDGRLTTAEGSIEAQGTALSTLTTRVSNAEGNISSNTSAITALTGRVGTVEDDVTANTSAISSLSTEVSNQAGEIDANTSAITALSSTVSDNTDAISGQATAISSLTTRVTDAEGTLTTQASEISSLATQVTDVTGDITANTSAITALTSQVDSNTDTLTAQVQQISEIQAATDAMQADVTHNNEVVASLEEAYSTYIFGVTAGTTDDYAGDDDEYAGNVTVMSAMVDGDRALSQQISTITASFGDQIATIQTSLTTQADDISANATAIQTVQASMEDMQASIETTQTAITNVDGSLAATYQIKVQVNTGGTQYAAGMQLGVTGDGTSVQSSVNFLADRFAIMNTSEGTPKLAFAASGGDVFIRSAMIASASITNAMIANAAITTAKIANAQITAALIADGNITNAKIGDAQITTAKIGTAQIDTLRIAGNAVTVAASWAYGPGTIFVSNYENGGWSSISSSTFSMPGAADVLVVMTISFAGAYTQRNDLYQIARLLFDGGQVGSLYNLNPPINIPDGNGYVPAVATSVSWIVPGAGAGNHTLTIQVANANVNHAALNGIDYYPTDAQWRVFAIMRMR